MQLLSSGEHSHSKSKVLANVLKSLTVLRFAADDEQFKEEKVVIIKEIQALRPPTPPQNSFAPQ